MILKAFSILDDKSSTYSPPFFMASTGLAIRAFGDLVEDARTSLAKHPSDYHLYQLGDWDDNSGEYVTLKSPLFVAHATDFVKRPVSESQVV